MNDNYNEQLKFELLNLIKNIPESNGSRYFNKIEKTVGIIADENMYNYYKDACNLIYINCDNRKSIIENNNIDIFLYVTAWKGIENDWVGVRGRGNNLFEVIEMCKEKNIPTVFQSKEDPSNYDTFIEVAKKCDYIFTTDINKIDDYKRDCKNENVYVLEFGINPLLHNPIGMRANKKLSNVMFAGSWMERYPHRCRDMEEIFKGVLSSNKKLDIIDRNFERHDERYFYPQEYLPFVTSSINYIDLQKVQKLYDWIINLNSIKYSSTMCAVRCYESQACGNCILSNYSKAVNYSSPNIFMIYDKSQVKYILNQFNEEELYNHQMYGVRNVMNDRCVFDKISYIFQIVNSNTWVKPSKKRVLIVTDKITSKISELFNNQIFNEKYLVEKDKAKNLYKYYDFITFFKEDYFYGEYYLQDMINGFKYTNSDYITKDSYYKQDKVIKGIEHNYIDIMKDKYKSVFDTKIFTFDFLNNLEDNTNLKNGYSIDHFQLIEEPYAKVNSMINSKNKLKQYKISIIIKVDNNGKYLLNKSFSSLKRSEIFDDMEIILVDNDSKDKETISILNKLNSKYNNVSLYKEKDINSHITSLVRGSYITFLEPYNEVVSDGYFDLYKDIYKQNLDLIMGSMLEVNDEEKIIQPQKELIVKNKEKDILKDKDFMDNIQGCLIKRSSINKGISINKIKKIDKVICVKYVFMKNINKQFGGIDI